MTRQRISVPVTLYYGPATGNDNNDGTSEYNAYKTLQCAMDHASGDFDFAPPFAWTPSTSGSTASGIGNVGYRAGVTIKQLPTSAADAFANPLTEPVYLDGLGQNYPITLRGDPASRESILAHNIYAANPFQGITAQNGAVLICDGITMRGDANCTLINPLEQGKIAIKNLFLGQGSTGPGGAVGAPSMAVVDIIGKITLIGSGFVAVFAAIEDGMLNFAPGAEVSLDNAMDFGTMFALVRGQAWTQGTPIVWSGPGLAGSTGLKFSRYDKSFIGFDTASIPGSPGMSDEI